MKLKRELINYSVALQYAEWGRPTYYLHALWSKFVILMGVNDSVEMGSECEAAGPNDMK